jgi:hypothetical protein
LKIGRTLNATDEQTTKIAAPSIRGTRNANIQCWASARQGWNSSALDIIRWRRRILIAETRRHPSSPALQARELLAGSIYQ